MSARFASAHSRWALLAILLVGSIVGAMVGSLVLVRLAAPDSVTAATAQSRSASCSPIDFVPMDSATGSDFSGHIRYRVGSQGSGFFTCNPGLPTRAVVTKVQISLYDGHPSGEAKYCGLYRMGLDQPTFLTVQELAAFGPTGEQAVPGFLRLTDTTILNGTIDNTKYSYWVQCNLSSPGSALGIVGASVTYSISATNG